MDVIFDFSKPEFPENNGEDIQKENGINNEKQKLSDYFHKFCKKRNKKSITLRIDEDILDWYQSSGSGYQTRINAALRAVMQAEKDK